ncbi:hypothetical protein AZOA_29870 [Azoarcus sp. Aa7]|nr:hypothetical protein [Azoarcus sp. Aa7]
MHGAYRLAPQPGAQAVEQQGGGVACAVGIAEQVLRAPGGDHRVVGEKAQSLDRCGQLQRGQMLAGEHQHPPVVAPRRAGDDLEHGVGAVLVLQVQAAAVERGMAGGKPGGKPGKQPSRGEQQRLGVQHACGQDQARFEAFRRQEPQAWIGAFAAGPCERVEHDGGLAASQPVARQAGDVADAAGADAVQQLERGTGHFGAVAE